jgi:hypothetical protein
MSDPRPLRAALFVDFDNIFSQLQEVDSDDTAHRFATHPTDWLEWMERGMPTEEDSPQPRRRLIVRKCYMNPRVFWRYRNYFTRAAFSVVDCPPLTQQGKTSTDIHMVMDILDTLGQAAHIDEFIILSGDSDFTPVLLRLRAHDRQTTVVSIGPAAEAYKAAADQVIDGGTFIEYSLGFPSPADQDRPAPAAAPPPPPPEFRPDTAAAAQVRARVLQLVRDSQGPVSLGALAQLVRKEFPGVGPENGWAGYETFGALIRGFDLEREGIQMTQTGPGYLHPPTGAEPVAPAASDVVTRICMLTGIPSLTAEQYAIVFQALADHLRDNEFSLAETAKRLRDVSVERGVGVSRKAINFILQGCRYAGYKFTSDDTAESVARAFRSNVANLCRGEQIELSPEEESTLDRWLLGSTVAEPPEAPVEAAAATAAG